jgi:putative selenate reductase
VTGAPAGQQDFVFHASVGYDLAGIRSEPVARFLDQLHDAAPLLGRLRDGLPPALRPFADVPVAGRIVSCVTLSTFHGCPPAEIERIVEHLFDRHGVHVVVKVNPTLLGFETVDELLRGRLGYRDLVLDREAFAHDLRWEQALGLFGRLSGAAARRGLTLGAKLTNTLTVLNSGQRFRDPVMYLSGQPLHVLAMTLADRFARETAGRIPLAFSAGIDAENFPEAVSCGLAPVTTCTDLLHPTGYRRLPRYLRRLEEEMAALDARSIPEFIVARAGPQGTIANGSRARVPVASEASVRAAALVSLSARAASLPSETRYHAAQNSTAPLKTGRALSLFDCDSCNACLVACPNDAFFSLALGPMTHDAPDVTFAGRRAERPVRFELKSERQWAVFADFCNECGNCDTFCPDTGEPQVAKPRFFGSRESFEADAPRDGILIEARGARAFARFGGVLHRLSREGEHVHFSDGVIEATLDRDGHLLATRSLAPHKGHVLPLWRYHALRVLVDAVVDGINPVTAGWMAEAVGHAESPA